MTYLGPRLGKLVLTAHVTASVGWLGAVAAVLALAVAGVASDDGETVRAVYFAMELIGAFVLVPLALATLVTGLVQSFGSKWGLFRHYWVIAKLLITVVSTIVLVLYLDTLEYLADVAAETSAGDLGVLRTPSVVLHACAALVLLLLATALAVHKPQGVTRYGWRKQQERRHVRRR